jgi:general stress protein 26
VARWQDIENSAPEFAAEVRRYFDARVHKTLATVRADGSPRISGTEAYLRDGDLWFGSMSNARKALDLRRDPRFALHSGSTDPPDWEGDAKINGLAEEVHDPERESHLFRADIQEAVLVGLNEARNGLVIQLWRPDGKVRRIERQ